MGMYFNFNATDSDALYFHCNGCDQQQSKTKQDTFVKEDAWKATNTTSCCGVYLWNPEFSRMQDFISPRAWYSNFLRSFQVVFTWVKWNRFGMRVNPNSTELSFAFEKTLKWTFEVQKDGGEQLRKDHWNHYEAAWPACGLGKFSRDSCQVAWRLQCFVMFCLQTFKSWFFTRLAVAPKRPKWKNLDE